MSARDIIRNVLLDERDIDGCLHLSDSILEALTSAGYRILAPGALDKETLEAAAKVAGSMVSDPGEDEEPGDDMWVGRTSWNGALQNVAAAIRALGGGEG